MIKKHIIFIFISIIFSTNINAQIQYKGKTPTSLSGMAAGRYKTDYSFFINKIFTPLNSAIQRNFMFYSVDDFSSLSAAETYLEANGGILIVPQDYSVDSTLTWTFASNYGLIDLRNNKTSIYPFNYKKRVDFHGISWLGVGTTQATVNTDVEGLAFSIGDSAFLDFSFPERMTSGGIDSIVVIGLVNSTAGDSVKLQLVWKDSSSTPVGGAWGFTENEILDLGTTAYVLQRMSFTSIASVAHWQSNQIGRFCLTRITAGSNDEVADFILWWSYFYIR